MSECTRCLSPEITDSFSIKFGLHDWTLCAKCSGSFWFWVAKSCRYCLLPLHEEIDNNYKKMNKTEMICNTCESIKEEDNGKD